MCDGENRGKDDLVTKSIKTGAAIIGGTAIEPRGECDAQAEGIRLNDFADASIVAACRSRKASGRADVADQIGLGLRNVYDDVLSQPVPDRFFDLLRQLERVGGPQLKKDAL
jgi:hypothetical protein